MNAKKQLSKHEQRMLRHALKQELSKDKKQKQVHYEKKHGKWVVVAIAILLLSGFGLYYAVSVNAKPGVYDGFAKCLTDKGAVMYGATWCQYTKTQKKMFGKSMKYIDYRDYSENKDVRITPTWYFKDKKYEGVQDFYALRDITGCTWE